MTFFPEIYIRSSDSPSVDAFGRYRISEPETLFDSKQLFDGSELFWTTKYETSATGTHNANRASTLLSVTSTSGSLAIRQSKQRIDYQPGKSLKITKTFIMDEGNTNIRKRVGYFDDSNGIFLEQNGKNINCVLRSNVTGTPVDTVISQSAWNKDKLDGTGASQVNLDLTKAQIMIIDFQWLGAGRVRISFANNGSLINCHEFLHANNTNSVYMSTPNLPIRYEIKTTGNASTTGTLEQICSSAVSEGGYEPIGQKRTANRGTGSIEIVSENELVPLISIRKKSNYIGAKVIPTGFSIMTTTSADLLWELTLNPTINGSDNANWQSVVSSSVEYDISRDVTNSLSGGIVIRSGYVAGGNAQTPAQLISEDESPGLQLGSDLNNNVDEMVLSAQVIGGTTENLFAAISWREIT